MGRNSWKQLVNHETNQMCKYYSIHNQYKKNWKRTVDNIKMKTEKRKNKAC